MPQRCVIYGNCQGTALDIFLRFSPEFARLFTPCVHSNWQQTPFPLEQLEDCALFLYQPTKDRGGLAPSTEAMLDALPPHCVRVAFPYVYFNGYWPFHTDSPHTDVGRAFPKERHYYADSVLDKLAATPLPVERILNIYRNLDFEEEHPAAERLRETLRIQREREERTDIKSADLIEAAYRTEHIFLTVRHPSNTMYLRTSNRLLRLLGLPLLPDRVAVAAPSPYNVPYAHPIHPGLARVLGLEFVTDRTRYNLWGDWFDYEAYLRDYIENRRLLQALAA
ncbi:WcbI family polysaccharide biosynthesis putative acetyltransferase [Paucidesulfovibrio longus]|uniref:WcbI family polysaccharide biosynthesis putative acetyltransferase n=1 Tax=Paucidesulfovibrio longus TaxID=889 RepID=UPI0003B6175F|nr:WcbI family polysaccharide biosynthesis putative acetyltransferase [Paucidesulfovibrio longus]